MKWFQILVVFPLFGLLISCTQAQDSSLNKVGLILPHPIDDQGWNNKGYQGILKVQSTLNVDVLMKEDIRSRELVREVVNDFHEEGVGLIFGHSHLYADLFMELKDDYPDIHFVSFNGEVEGDNITSLHFEGYAMGYFAGMLASEMSDSGIIGVIAAFSFQPEVQGFIDGATYHSDVVDVQVDFVEDWSDEDKAYQIFEVMINEDVDVFYPAGDGFHVSIIGEVKREGLYGIGYVGDQLDLGESTILTSTVQEVEKLYEYIALQYKNGNLETGNKYFDFQQGVISMGEFGQEVPPKTRKWLEDHIDVYVDSGILPHELNSK